MINMYAAIKQAVNLRHLLTPEVFKALLSSERLFKRKSAALNFRAVSKMTRNLRGQVCCSVFLGAGQAKELNSRTNGQGHVEDTVVAAGRIGHRRPNHRRRQIRGGV